MTTAQQNIAVLQAFARLNPEAVVYEQVSATVAGVYFGTQLITFPIKVMKPEKVIELLNHEVKRRKKSREHYIEYSTDLIEKPTS